LYGYVTITSLTLNSFSDHRWLKVVVQAVRVTDSTPCHPLAYINGYRQWKMSEVGLYSTQFGIQSQTLQGEHIFVFIKNYSLVL